MYEEIIEMLVIQRIMMTLTIYVMSMERQSRGVFATNWKIILIDVPVIIPKRKYWTLDFNQRLRILQFNQFSRSIFEIVV